MVEVVFALLLIVDNEIKEHRIQDSLSKCLKAKRYAMRDKGAEDRVTYQCIKSKANIEIYMGEKKITSLILDDSSIFAGSFIGPTITKSLYINS